MARNLLMSRRFGGKPRISYGYARGMNLQLTESKVVPFKKSTIFFSTSTIHQVDATKFPGFSKEVIKPACDDVGPGAMKEGSYQNPEYFCYNKYSYYELHILLRTFRLPQPSSLSKQDQQRNEKIKTKC